MKDSNVFELETKGSIIDGVGEFEPSCEDQTKETTSKAKHDA